MRQKSVLKNEYKGEGEKVKERSSEKSIRRHLNGLFGEKSYSRFLLRQQKLEAVRAWERVSDQLFCVGFRRLTSIKSSRKRKPGERILEIAIAFREEYLHIQILEVGPPHLPCSIFCFLLLVSIEAFPQDI